MPRSNKAEQNGVIKKSEGLNARSSPRREPKRLYYVYEVIKPRLASVRSRPRVKFYVRKCAFCYLLTGCNFYTLRIFLSRLLQVAQTNINEMERIDEKSLPVHECTQGEIIVSTVYSYFRSIERKIGNCFRAESSPKISQVKNFIFTM